MTETVTRAVFEAEERGVAATAGALNQLTGAASGSAKAVDVFGKTSQTAAQEIRGIEQRVDAMQKRLAGAPAAWSRYEAAMRTANQAQEAGTLTGDKYAATVRQIQTELQKVVAPRLDMDAANSSLTTLLGNSQKVGAAQREMARDMLATAQARQKADAEAARGQALLAEQATKLRTTLDPLGAAQARLNSELAEYQNLAAKGLITNDELIAATTKANDGYQVMAAKLGAVGTQAKLTQQQMLNLSRQGNDVLTMAFMGMPLSMIATSQIGQIYGALEENDRGVRGSMEAIKGYITSVATAIGPLRLGLAAVGVAGVAAAVLIGRSWPSATEVAEKHVDVIRRAEERYAGLADAIARMRRESDASFRRDLSAQTGDQQTLYRAAVEGLTDYAIPNALASWDGALQPIAGLVREFVVEVESGETTVRAFQAELDALAVAPDTSSEIQAAIKAFKDISTNANEAELRLGELGLTADRASDSFRRITRNASDFKQAMAGLSNFAAPVSSAQQIESAFQSAMDTAQSYGQVMAAVDARGKALVELSRGPMQEAEAAANRLANLSLSPDARTIAEIRQNYDAQIADLERVNGAEEAIFAKRRERDAAVAAASLEIGRAETARRDGAALDLRAVNARTAAEKASIESERVRIDLMAQGYTATEAAARATEAYTLAIAQSSAEWTRAAESRQFAREDALANAQAQVNSFGMTAGAAQAYGQAIQQLTAYRRAAAEAGMPIDPAEEQAIRDAASAAGAYTDALARMNMERDQAAQIELLRAEARLVGLSENARSVAMAGLQAEADLRRDNISTTDAWGQSYIRNAEHAARFRIEIDRQTEAYQKQRDALSNVASTFLDIFTDTSSDSFFDRIMKGLADIGRQFAELGKQKLLENLTGGALGYTTGQPAPGQRSVAQPGFSGGVIQAANQNLPSSAFIPTPTAAVRQTTQRLAEGVTTSVSRNLLSNMLSAGKSQSHISGLNQEFAVALTNMFSEAPAAVRSATNIYSGFRSVERQAELFRGAVAKYGSEQAARKWVAPPGNSQHNRGMAADLSYGNSAARQWIHANAGRYGLAFPLGHENWHIELAGARGGGARSAMQAVSNVQAGSPTMMGGSNGNVPIPTPRPGVTTSASGGTGWFGQGGRLQGFMQSPTGMGAMNALGAFGAGQQGGMLSGAMTGGLGAIGMGLPGPLALLGVGAGLLGGLFGGRQKRKQEHQQRAEAWAAQAQEWAAYQDEVRTGVGPTSGLRASQEAMANRLTGFVQTGSAAWKMGSNNSSALFSQVGAELAEYFARTNAEFGRAYEAQIASLNAGQGLSGPFISARDEILEAGKTLATFVDDTRVVFGDGSVEAQRAAEASIAQLRALLTGGQELSDIAAAVEQMRGAAAGLHTQLEVLGKSAEDAGKIVRDDLTTAMDRLRSDFTLGIQDQINDLDGKGYLADFRALVEGVQQTMQDAALLGGVDTSLVDTFFAKSAQNLVNQAELTGAAFDELMSVFPQLSGVVKAFSEAVVTATETETRSAIEGYENRLFAAQNGGNDLVAFERQAARERVEAAKFGADAVAALEKTLAAERANIVVAGARADLDQAWREHQDAVNERIRALRDEASELERTVSRLTGFSSELRDFIKTLVLDDSLSTLSDREMLNEAEKQYRDIAMRAAGGDEDAQRQLTSASERYLSLAREFFGPSSAYADIFNEVKAEMTRQEATASLQLTEAQRQLDALNKQITLEEEGLKLAQQQYEALLGINHGVLSLGTAMAAFATAMAAARAAGVDAGPGGSTTPTDASFGRGVDYLNKNPDVAAGIAAGQTFGLPAGSSLEAIAKAHWERHGQYEDPTKRKGYALGGYVTGPGTGTSDSIKAWLSNGEHVTRAMSVNRETRPVLDHVNLTGRLPRIAMPVMTPPSAPANQNSGPSRDEMARFAAAIGASVAAQTRALEEKFDATIAELKGSRTDARNERTRPQKQARVA